MVEEVALRVSGGGLYSFYPHSAYLPPGWLFKFPLSNSSIARRKAILLRKNDRSIIAMLLPHAPHAKNRSHCHSKGWATAIQSTNAKETPMAPPDSEITVFS